MTESNDELLERLAAADPVDHHALPSGADQEPQLLLEQIMTTESNADHEPVELLELPKVRGIDQYAGSGRNRLRVLATAAAVLLLVVGFVVFSPDNTAPALATVRSAAQATADFDSGRVETSFTLNGSDGSDSEVSSVDGSVLTEFAGSDVRLSLDVDDSTGSLAGPLPATTEARLVDDVLYVNDDGSWYDIETGGLIGQTVVDFVDPRNVLIEVEDLVDTTEVGSAVIDGVDTTQYQSIVDLSEESLREAGWLPVDMVNDMQAEGEMTVNLYIDDTGLLRQLTVDGDVVETGGEGTASFSITTRFFDLGGDVTVEAPAESTTIDPEAGLNLEDLELDG